MSCSRLHGYFSSRNRNLRAGRLSGAVVQGKALVWALQEDLFITSVYNAHCKEVWHGLQTWDTIVKLIWMEKDKRAVAMEATTTTKKSQLSEKIFAITKEFLIRTHQSPLWQALKEKRPWEKKKKREKIMERGREGWGRERLRQWTLLTCHSTTLAFN